jgi:hypothetical protein
LFLRISQQDKQSAKMIHEQLMSSAQYAPWWVRILSALCLGGGTMVGYKRRVAPRNHPHRWRRANRIPGKHHPCCHRRHCGNNGGLRRRNPTVDSLADCRRMDSHLARDDRVVRRSLLSAVVRLDGHHLKPGLGARPVSAPAVGMRSPDPHTVTRGIRPESGQRNGI